MENNDIKTSDSFDIESLRLDTDSSNDLVTKKVIVNIPVRKPGPQEFIRVHPDEKMRALFYLLEWLADRETYLVTPAMAEVIGKQNAKPHRLIPAMTANGILFFWKMKITPEGGRENTWNVTADLAAAQAITNWVNVTSNTPSNSYDVRIAEGNIPEPTWPDLDLQAMLKIAFKGHFIQSVEHPLVQKLKGNI